MAMHFQDVKLIVVDDDRVAVMGVKRAIDKLRIANQRFFAQDGREALEMIRGEAGFDEIAPPFLVLLDLNMPRMNGHQFLEELRRDPTLHDSVVFVMKNSDEPDGIDAACDRFIGGYVLRENLFETLRGTLEVIDTYERLLVVPTKGRA